MREANLKTRLVQAKDEYASAVTAVEECRGKLSYAKQQVNMAAQSSPLLYFLHFHKSYDILCSGVSSALHVISPPARHVHSDTNSTSFANTIHSHFHHCLLEARYSSVSWVG